MARPNDAVKKDRIVFSVDGKRQAAGSAWYRGESCNFNPNRDNMIPSDTVFKHVLSGWLPKEPLIGPQTNVTAFGSCFAAHIRDWLRSRNYNVLTKGGGEDAGDGSGDTYISRFGEGLVNSFVLRQQFEWAWSNTRFSEELWHGYDAESYGYDESVRQKTKEIFDRTDVFIITLGLSEIWYDAQTGGVFWRAVPLDKFDPERHKFRVSTVSETRENIRAIYDLISQHRPEAKVIFTVSPVPLVATFRPVSCITANSVSKAIIRAALDEVLREVVSEGRAFYWPSYEIVMDVFGDSYDPDRRHVRREVLDFIMNMFEHTWCHGTTPRYTVAEAWINARAADGTLPAQLPTALSQKDVSALDRIFNRLTTTNKFDHAALIVERAVEIGESDAVLADWAQRRSADLAEHARLPKAGRGAQGNNAVLPESVLKALANRDLTAVNRAFRNFVASQRTRNAAALLERARELGKTERPFRVWARRKENQMPELSTQLGLASIGQT